MENQVEEIKRKLDIVSVISRYIPLKKKGRHYTANCPFHGEKTPSFMVSPELQIYKCFGCSKAGDVFSFVQEYERVDFREALEELAKVAGVTLVKNDQLTAIESKKKKLLEINNEVARFYHYMLTSHDLGKPAREYLEGRGFTPETIKLFKVGFSPRDSQYISQYLLKKNYDLRDLTETGTFGVARYGHSGIYDRFSGRLIFPLMDYRDRVLGFAGRVLPGADTNQAKYINSPETDLYHKSHLLFGLNVAKDAIREQKNVIIVEGEIDMISPYQHGIKNIVAVKGTAFTKEQLELLHRYTDTLILGFDSDFAGNSAARRSIEMADSMGFDLKVLSVGPKYKDPDEAVKADPVYFDQQLKAAVPIWDFIIESAVAANDPTTLKGKKTTLEIVLPFIAKISNAVIKADYIRKLALEIGSTPESITQEIAKYLSAPTLKSQLLPQAASVNRPPTATKKSRLVHYLLTLILSSKNPSLVAKRILKTLPDIFNADSRQSVIVSSLISNEFINIEQLRSTIPAEIIPYFESSYLEGEGYGFESIARKKEIDQSLTMLTVLDLKERLKNTSQKIALLESRGDETLLNEAEKDYNTLLRQLSKLEIPGP